MSPALVVMAVLTAGVVDEADVLNASRRAELAVAAEDEVTVVLFDGADAGEADRRAEVLARQGRSAVLFDLTSQCGAIVVRRAPRSDHERLGLARQHEQLCGGGAWFQRVFRAVSFVRLNDAPDVTASAEVELAARPSLTFEYSLFGALFSVLVGRTLWRWRWEVRRLFGWRAA